MSVKTTKNNKKENFNNNITENIEAFLQGSVKNTIKNTETIKNKINETYQQNTKKISEAFKKNEEVPHIAAEINESLVRLQQKLLSLNIELCSQLLTCYSIQDMNNLYSKYLGKIYECFIEEGNNFNNSFFNMNNIFFKEMFATNQ